MSFYGKVLEKINVINCIKKERGAIFVLTALLLPIMFGCLGIAYDVGTVYMHKARLQNVADAAALAGGRAYLQSQTKTNGKDSVDGTMDYRSKDIANCTYKGGRSMTVKYEYGKETTIDRGNTTQHPDADAAADTYIFNNIVNLGNTVYADKYSHFALNYGNATSKIFYRIGLFEKVPLHFLPVITNKNVETVRAGSVVVVEPEKTTTTIIPGTGETQTVSSLFDKLFVVEKGLEMTGAVVTNPDDPALGNISKITSTFEGEMVFTDSDWTQDAYWAQGHKGFYLFSGQEAQYKTDENISVAALESIPNTGTRVVHDNSIAITSYIPGFEKKLSGIHFDLQKNLGDFRISNLNSIFSQTQEPMYSVQSTEGTIYFHNSNNNYYNCYETFVRFDTNNYYRLRKLLNSVWWNNKEYDKFVNDEEGNKILIHYENGQFSFIREVIINHGTWSETSWAAISATKSESEKAIRYSYQNNDSTVAFEIEKLNVDFTKGTLVPADQIKNSSVLHWNCPDSSANLYLDAELKGSESDPLYIILGPTHGPKVNVTVSNERPIVFCYLGTEQLNLNIYTNNVTFKGMIYAPYCQTDYNEKGNFIGNITTKLLRVQGPGDTHIQKNFVANDKDLNGVSDEAAASQEKRKKQATNYAKQQLASYGITEETWNDKNWFSKLTPEKRKQIQEAWNSARFTLWKETGLDMPDWPWSTGGKTTDPDRHHYSIGTGGSTGEQVITTTTPETLRLINYRTEFLLKETMNDDDVVDPFIFETLRQPNSY